MSTRGKRYKQAAENIAGRFLCYRRSPDLGEEDCFGEV